jgi:formimidoylglutamate deiminase
MTAASKAILADHAWLPQGWRRNVLLAWDAESVLTTVQADCEPAGEVEKVQGIVLPGMSNLHSHAFQRAMAGLTEYRSPANAGAGDSFWSWRQLMYAFAQKLGPAALKAIALQLYIEMLKAGYTSVCEFHYLHHDRDGKPYANPAELATCLIEAAQEAGIGLTLLPVLYQYSGFGARAPQPQQARFVSSPEWILTLLQRLQSSHPQHAGLRYGVAPHSLRAVSPDSLKELLAGLARFDRNAPVHIHIAEQRQEVDDCLTTLGARPVEWLLQHAAVDARWCLVHATHMSPAETRALAQSGAVAGLCPSTEANLGDGFFNAIPYDLNGGQWGIGSDSHASVSLREELRLLEYGQRLLSGQRNVLAHDSGGSVGAHLYRGALAGGAAAAGRPVAGLTVGQRADLLVLDPLHPDLGGKRDDQWLDSLIFCNHGATPIGDVMSAGRWVVRAGRHASDERSAAAYRAALESLLA